MKKIAELFLYLWQLPQNLLGLLLIFILGRVVPVDFRGHNHRLPSSILFFHSRMRGGISLGRYIIMADWCFTETDSWYHERGHSIQSMILGPLYLFVIGIPSLLWAAWWNPYRKVSYYWFYTEAWANKLGGVERC